MTKYSRRGFTGLLLVLFGSFWRTGSRAMANEDASGPHSDSDKKLATPRAQVRHYRADAAILLLGITIFRRSGVGSGQASIEESAESGESGEHGDGKSTTRTLFFAAGSDPARAHGLNRLGWMREVVQAPNSIPTEVQYFGVLTASPEETLEHARKSFDKPASSGSTYSAVSGRNTPGDSRSAISHFELGADTRWSDRRLIDAAQSTFQDKVDWRETAWPKSGNQTPSTFLLELATLLLQRERHAAGRYVYSEQEYLLELDKPELGNPAGKAKGLLPVHGKIHNRRTGGQTTFTIWMEDSPGSLLPMRIEYQPRSFLRLVFEGVAV